MPTGRRKKIRCPAEVFSRKNDYKLFKHPRVNPQGFKSILNANLLFISISADLTEPTLFASNVRPVLLVYEIV
jgi:hypothetical protein